MREEQVWAHDRWVTYSIRGGPQQADALFAPTTKTPWTDDLQVNWETELGAVIATLAGGARDYQGREISFRQRLLANWQALAAYTYGTASGSTNSDLKPTSRAT